MNNDTGRHLDGELPREALDQGGRREADAWDRMVTAFRTDSPRGGAPAWLEQKVMAEIDALPEPGLSATVRDWLLSPRPIRVSPLAAGLVAALFVAVILMPDVGPSQATGPAGATAAQMVSTTSSPESPLVYVQFVLEAPSAQSVAVAGDFSDWEAGFALTDADGDGVWTGRVPVRPGVHTYMFLIDGDSWQTDPRADRYQDDGFGNQNAVLAVGASE